MLIQIATVISATANWKFTGIKSIGWGWTGFIWLFNIVTYLVLDPLKFAVRYALSGRAWGLLVNQRTAFIDKKDFGKGAQEAKRRAEISRPREIHTPKGKVESFAKLGVMTLMP
ncbi:hypothetical protein QYF36_025440 [Acer negundo]|nr:hypothetical protein QYF36_025440 [Acer negundo]